MKPLSNQHGFTLIELLTAVAVLAVLVGVAVPSFLNMIRTNALTSSSNQFVAAVALTRGEAIKRGSIVRLCIQDGASCGGNGTDWGQGWILYADADNDDALDAGEEVRFFDGIRSNYTLTASDNSINSIAYNGQGRLLDSTAFNIRLCAADAQTIGDTTRSRTLTFNTIGRVTPSEGAATCP